MENLEERRREIAAYKDMGRFLIKHADRINALTIGCSYEGDEGSAYRISVEGEIFLAHSLSTLLYDKTGTQLIESD